MQVYQSSQAQPHDRGRRPMARPDASLVAVGRITISRRLSPARSAQLSSVREHEHSYEQDAG
jgi:hypothetical protein